MSGSKAFKISFILLAILLSLAKGMTLCSEESDNFCTKEPDYNKYRNPDYPNPTTIHLDIIIRDILDIDEEKHLFEIVAYSNARWREPRIDIRSISVSNPQSVIRPTEAELNEVWTTNPTYPNAAIVSKRFTYNTATRLSGDIWFKYTMVYKSFLTCAMDFSNYPFDSHTCFWKLRSHYENSVDTEKLVIDTLQSEQDSKIVTSKDQTLIIDSNTLPYHIELSIGQESIDLAEGVNKSTASVQFKFTRKNEGRNELLTGYFVPTGLFATLSLVSYLIKPEIVPGRMGMLVVLFLILTNIHGTVKGPSSRGFSYVEVWYVGMFIPIVVAIIEYAAVLAAIKYKTETQYESIVCGKTKMKRLVAHIDMAFMLFNFLFLACFIFGFFIKILSL